ncbi:tail spike protein [Aeromonas phage AerS_266]|nr:tail spike protein [Aeromonas phage AerS_266]
MSSTGNPIGSPDFRDAYLNATNLDFAMNSEEDTFTDRFGVERITYSRMERKVNDFEFSYAQGAGAGKIGFSSDLEHLPATVGFKLANAIDITDAPYNARANQTDISTVLKLALATGRPIYFPEPKNPANYYLVNGTILNLQNTIIHGPKTTKIVFAGVVTGLPHVHARGKITHVFGLTLESTTRGVLIRAEPNDIDGIDEVKCLGTEFKGGFYAVRAGTSITALTGYPTKRVIIDSCKSTASNEVNGGHFLCFSVDDVKYLHSDVTGGRNTSVFGAARCKTILIDGCSETGLAQTLTNVEAGAQIEDSENCNGRIINCNFEHDIWISSSSGVKVSSCFARVLRVSTGSQYSTFEMKDITFIGNTAGRFVVEKYGSVNNPQRCNVDFFYNTLDPASHSNMGNSYTTSYNIAGSVCKLLRFKGNKNISDALTYAMSISRNTEMRIEIDSMCEFGSKPHILSNAGGRILSAVELKSAVPNQGNTPISDIQLGFSANFTPTATGNFVNIPFTQVGKNLNGEWVDVGIVPIEDCIYSFSGIFTVNVPADGTRVAIRLFNETDNFVLQTFFDTRVFSGINTLPIPYIAIKLLAGKVYRVQYVTGNAGCEIITSFSNTNISIKALI